MSEEIYRINVQVDYLINGVAGETSFEEEYARKEGVKNKICRLIDANELMEIVSIHLDYLVIKNE